MNKYHTALVSAVAGARRRTGGFDPASYGDAVFFRTRFQDLTLSNNDLISTAEDTVGTNDLTASGGARPTFKTSIFGTKAGARFTTSQFLQSAAFSSPLAQDYTVAVLFRTSSVVEFGVIVDGLSSGRCLTYISSNQINAYAGSFLAPSTTYPVQDWGHTLIVHFNGGSSTVYLDSRLVASGSVGSQTLDGFTLGAAFDGSAGAGLDIAEAIIWEGDIGSIGRTAVHAYGVSEYAINGGYTISDITIAGVAARLIVPDIRVAGTAIIYCHGLGETATSVSETGDKALYVYGALASGYMIASSTAGGNTWSNATAETDYEALAAYIIANYAVADVVMWAQSAGGPISLLKAVQGFSGITVAGWFGIYPVVDLDSAYGVAALTPSIDSAFPSYPTDASGRDPALFAGSTYAGLRLRCVQSASDTITPKADHGDVLVTLATGHATEVACVATSGEHGDNSNFSQTRANDFVSFLGRCLP
jgi:hypothetical protein